MFGENLADVVEAVVEKILLVMVSHPLRQNCATTADDSSDAPGNHGQILDEHAGVNGHVIHALLGLLFNHFEHHLGSQIFDALYPRDSFVNRNGSNRHWRMTQDRLANFMNVTAG